MNENNILPKGWKMVNFDDVCEIFSGKNQKDVADENGIYPIYGSGGIIGKSRDYLCEPGTTIIGRKGTINTPIFVNEKFWNVDTAFGLSPNSSYHKLLFHYYCLSFDFKKLDKSTTIPSLAKTDLLQIKIPLPPLPEQHRIVAKIEELFSSLDKGIESLKTAQQQLKVYRQAVLKWAFEGRFTNPNVKEGELPEGWKIEELKKITLRSKKVKVKEQKQDDVFIYLDIGSIDNSILKIVCHKQYQWKNAPSRAQQIIEIGDTLFSTVRTYLMNIAFVDKEIYHNQIASSGFTVIRADREKVEPKYLFYYSTYKGFINPLNKLQTGTSYPAVRDEDVFSQQINYPVLLAEQQLIVSEIEKRLSVADKLEESIATALQQAEALRQSILKKAFEGKLLSETELEECRNDPNWEPASVLLERIASAKLSIKKAERHNKTSQDKNKPAKNRVKS